MAQDKLISIDLRADLGFLKKPDYNEGILLSYNMLHKPALLGILGAVIGLAGYRAKGEFPDYYKHLNTIPTGIAPLEGWHEKGNFIKSSVKYSNTVGYANKDGNLLIEETMLLKPAYRCFMLLSLDNEEQAKLYENLKNGEAEFIPYLGKNEYQAWWLDEDGQNSFKEYSYKAASQTDEKLHICSLFRKTVNLKEQVEEDTASGFNFFDFAFTPQAFAYFERLPVGFDPDLLQYELQEFAFSNLPLQADVHLPGLYYLPELDGYVQLS